MYKHLHIYKTPCSLLHRVMEGVLHGEFNPTFAATPDRETETGREKDLSLFWRGGRDVGVR